jgi:hypothetical protein
MNMAENIKTPLAPHKYPELARSRGPRQLPPAAAAAKPRPTPAPTNGASRAHEGRSGLRQQDHGGAVSHAARSVFRKYKLKERRLRSIAASLPPPPERRWHGPIKEALGQERFEDKAAAA